MNMTMQSMLREKNMSMYRLSQISGVPKTTVIDICSGKSDIEGCTAKTVLQLSRALGCTMEELMQIGNSRYDRATGLPKDESYLEKGLPAYLQKSIAAMQGLPCMAVFLSSGPASPVLLPAPCFPAEDRHPAPEGDHS